MKSCIVSIVRLGPVDLLGLVAVLWIATMSIVQGNRQRGEQVKHRPAPKCLAELLDRQIIECFDGLYESLDLLVFNLRMCVFYYATDAPYRPLYGAPWCYNMFLPCLKHFWKHVDTRQIKTASFPFFSKTVLLKPCLGKASTGQVAADAVRCSILYTCCFCPVGCYHICILRIAYSEVGWIRMN